MHAAGTAPALVFRRIRDLSLLCLTCALLPPARAQFVQQASLPVPDGTVNFGAAVALSADGNTAVIGAPQENGLIGGVWIYDRVQGAWTQSAHLVGTGAVPTPYSGPNGSIVYIVAQGTSVALSADGNTAIVGGPADNGNLGAAWVFVRTNGVWTQQGDKLVGAGAVGSSSSQGYSVALSADGNTALVGGYCDDNCNGAVWVFVQVNGIWTQQGAKLVGTGETFSVAGNAQMGHSVALSADGNTAIAGGFWDNDFIGAAWVFVQENGTWVQQGDKLVGTGAQGPASQAFSVAISPDGNTAVIGGPEDNNNVGAAWVLTRSNGAWFQQGTKLVGSDVSGQAGQGISVAISGDAQTIVVGGSGDNSSQGATWVFTNTSGTWVQQGAKLIGTPLAPNAQQGYPVAISGDGNTIMIGGDAYNGYIGGAWAFVRPGATTTTLSSSAASGYAGATITFTCTVTGQPWTGPPVGTVTLLDYGSAILGASALLDNTGAANMAPVLAPGNHSISCSFVSSNGVTLPSTSPAISETVVKAPVLVAVNTTPSQAKVGQSVSILVSVSPAVGIGNPTGTVTLFDGAQSIGALALVNGQATLTIAFTTPGFHPIQANYSGDNNYLNGSSSTVLLVGPKFNSTVALTSSLSNSVYGQPMTFLARVGPQPPTGAPVQSGQVQFLDGTTPLGTVVLSGATASLTVTNLSVGAHNIAANYAGDVNWNPAQSVPLPQTVTPAATITALSLQPGATQAALIATISVKKPGGGSPDGTVVFTDTLDGKTLGNAQITGNTSTASLSVTPAQLGNRMGHQITAQYSGSVNFAGSTSANLVLPTLANAAWGKSSGFAPDEIVSLHGSDLATSTFQSSAPTLPTTFGGISLSVSDSTHTTRSSGLYLVSPRLINFVVPSGTSLGTALMTLTTGTGAVLPIQVTVTTISPGIFTLDGSGSGVPAGQIVRVHPDGSRTTEPISSSPIAFGADTLYLNLFATGIRHLPDLGKVVCSIAGHHLPAEFAGARLNQPGMDQVNLQLQGLLKGAGKANVVLNVDGQLSNTVTLTFQ